MEKASESEVKRDDKGLFLPGGSPKSLGRPKQSTEQKIVKKAVKQYLEEYEQSLAETLPVISPVLRNKAMGGDMAAIREIHEVVGAHKKSTASNTIVDSNVLILIEKAKKILPE